MMMNKAYLLIGGNMGAREGYLAEASKQIEKKCGVISKQSSLYQTAAWGLQEQAPFLNQALEVQTRLNAEELLEKILSIEESLGRKRKMKYGPRIIDIDILLFNNEIIYREGLTIPHPEMQNRRFALEPLNEIASSVLHPIFLKTIAELLQECPDNLDVQKI